MNRYTIWDEIQKMQEQMDMMFDHFFEKDPWNFGNKNLLSDFKNNKNGELIESNYKKPISDIYETENEFIIEVEIPGIEKKDIKIDLNNNSIDIKAESKNEYKTKENKKGFCKIERNYTGFYRHFSLPENIDIDKSSAEYKEGLLKITIPKTLLETTKRKLLEIK
ncbi:MAG: Hsp20/alpha crystallin family protein [Candidatus Nanoarchaeia archaeon]|nr:Hsp20/alpha crystallin family protein [Candidatus Nanoarchaeia archaeon]